jgi:hypothetical protein
MKLRQLEAHFIRREERMEEGQRVKAGVDPLNYTDVDIETAIWPHVYLVPVDTLAEADGIIFLCPLCYRKDNHSVICWFEGKVSDDVKPGPGRWNPVGTGIDDITFVPGKKTQSVALQGGCNWHGFVINGDAT